MRAYFASDNYAPILPEALEAIAAANHGHATSYGADEWTARLQAAVESHFHADAAVFPVFNGTGANVVGLRAMLRPWQGVVCAESAHLNVDECGAPEAMGGIKLLTVPTADGKLTPDLVEQRLVRIGDEHVVQPGVVSVTEATEYGTVYTPAELAVLASFAHEHGMLFHVDGARLANAAASLDLSLAAITSEIGADVVSFGGTKVGVLAGEAVVVLRSDLIDSLPYLRKQSMQLASKMRFVSAQLLALLEDELWLRVGRPRERDGEPARGWCARCGDGHAGRAGQLRLRDPAARRGRGAPARVQVLRLERAHRRGSLDVLLGHERGGRRRVRGGDPRGDRCRPRTTPAMRRRSA